MNHPDCTEVAVYSWSDELFDVFDLTVTTDDASAVRNASLIQG